MLLVLLCATLQAGCGQRVGMELLRVDARADVRRSSLPPIRQAEPWKELAAKAPAVGEFLASDPVTANLNLRQLRVAADEPPAPRRPARRLQGRLTTMMLAWQRGDVSAALAQAGRLLEDPKLRLRDLTSLGMLGCVDCSLLAVRALRRRIAARGWSWTTGRWLLPLAGHSSERVRAAVVAAFVWARAHLAAQKVRRKLESFVRVFRHLAADPSPWVRAEALTLLGRMKDRSAHRLLVAATRDRFPVVRLAAVQAIAEAIKLVPRAPSTLAVCALLEDPSPAVRASVLDVLPRTQAPCAVARVVARLQDRFRAGLRLSTDASGSQGARGLSGEVRHAAWRALPPAFRAQVAPGAPWDDKIRHALSAIRRLQPKLTPGPAGDLRPMRPLPARLAAPPKKDLAAVQRRLAQVLSTGGPRLERLLLRTPALQRGLALRLAGLENQTLVQLLQACDVPLRSQLLAAVVGLLAHGSAEVRHAALERLRSSTVSDRRSAVLARALWLARKDPHALVRSAALKLLLHWHRGAAVRARLIRSLADPHPAVRYVAVSLVLEAGPGSARLLLPGRLPHEVPALRAHLLSHLVRRPALRPKPQVAARSLDDVATDEIRVTLGQRTHQVGGGFGSVRGAVLSALERAFGRRHRGTELQRAKRWQDDLLRDGWKLERPVDRP